MTVYPTKLERLGENQLLITWSDGEVRLYGAGELRNACPCATCREKSEKPAPPLSMLPVIPLNQAAPTTIKHMQPVGNYAYSIDFSDGHDTGIYSFELLRTLGKMAS